MRWERWRFSWWSATTRLTLLPAHWFFLAGKAAPGDEDPAVRQRAHGAEGLSDEEVILGACAIREAFEECGVLLARRGGEDELVGPEVIEQFDDWRPRLDRGGGEAHGIVGSSRPLPRA